MSGTNAYDEDVYQGIWINNSYGKWTGATLTLDRQRGAFLIAFLALFVGATGRSFWKIARFVLHMCWSVDAKSDGLYHQRLAILRNSSLATDAAFSMIQARWTWRRNAEGVNRKTLPAASISGLVAAAFVIAGIFSSRVTTNNVNEVLIAGLNCGNMTGAQPEMIDEQAAVWTDYYNHHTQAASKYLSYAYNCYRNESRSRSNQCSTYQQSVLPYTKITNAECPFSSEMCILPGGNVELDSGLLDSREHLGVNSGPRFQFRMTRRCGPVTTKNFTDIQNDEKDPSIRWLMYKYGTSAAKSRPYAYRLRFNASTSSLDPQDLTRGEDYTITAPTDLDLIPGLKKTGFLTHLMWLESTNIKNYAPIDDPWFKATTPEQAPSWLTSFLDIKLPNNTFYVADEPAAVLGCTTAIKICNPDMPDDRRCFDPTSSNLTWSDMWPDKANLATIRGYINYMQSDGLVYKPQAFYLTKGVPSLTTRFTLRGLLQPAAIPRDRWQDEMEYMFQANLAAAQGQVVELATGRSPPAREAFATQCGSVVPCNRLCHSQKIRTSGYSSFSVLGVSIILCIGILILLLGICIESAFDLVCKLFGVSNYQRIKYARLEWESNQTLQLQRLAHEAVGSGAWYKAVGSMPITQHREKLATLDISDPEHPRLIVDRELGTFKPNRNSSTSPSLENPSKWSPQSAPRSHSKTGYNRVATNEEL